MVTTSGPTELHSRRQLLRRATFSASLLLLVVPMLLPGRLQSAESRAAATNHIAIKAGHFVDVVRGEVSDNQIILIEGDVIKSVGAEGSVTIPGGATILDLSQSWVLPGLIDCHVHLTTDRGGVSGVMANLSEGVAAHVYEAAVNARKTLDAGFTTIRT
jgi:imidazolonepropionase-like amidohydrolase